MFDIGFFELLIIAVVLLLVMGPERLPEVARQAAFFIRKARQTMYRLRNEMQDEIDHTAFSDIDKARQEMADLKNDFKQFGRDLATSAEESIDINKDDKSLTTADKNVADKKTADETGDATS